MTEWMGPLSLLFGMPVEPLTAAAAAVAVGVTPPRAAPRAAALVADRAVPLLRRRCDSSSLSLSLLLLALLSFHASLSLSLISPPVGVRVVARRLDAAVCVIMSALSRPMCSERVNVRFECHSSTQPSDRID